MTWISISSLGELYGKSSPKFSNDLIRETGYLSIAAYNTSISFCNSSMSPWHGHALGEDGGIGGSSIGIGMQSPFPSLK